MSDLLHTHLTFGHRPGCPACAQLAADLASPALTGSVNSRSPV